MFILVEDLITYFFSFLIHSRPFSILIKENRSSFNLANRNHYSDVLGNNQIDTSELFILKVTES